MADVSGVTGHNPLAALQGATRALRVSPASPNAIRTNQPADVISFTKAAERLSQAKTQTQGIQASPSTYGVPGLQATTPSAAQREIGKLVAARVDAPMDYVSGQVQGRDGSLPFYTNPALANSAATSTSVARLGTSIDTTG